MASRAAVRVMADSWLDDCREDSPYAPGFLLARYDEGSRDRRETLAAPGQAEAVAGGGAEADARSGQRGRQRRLRVGAPRADPRRVADHLHGDVTDAKAGR